MWRSQGTTLSQPKVFFHPAIPTLNWTARINDGCQAMVCDDTRFPSTSSLDVEVERWTVVITVPIDRFVVVTFFFFASFCFYCQYFDLFSFCFSRSSSSLFSSSD